MRYINGITGCPKGVGNAEIDNDKIVSVRIVDAADNHIALRIGIHPESALLTPEEARHIGLLLSEAADRADTRS